MHKGRKRFRQVETRGVKLSFGVFGLKSMEEAWLTSRQIESAYRAIARSLGKEGKIWMRVFPDKPITKKAAETKMGKGKGSVDHYVFPVRPGRILFELDGVSYAKAQEAFIVANSKLPVKTSVVKK